MVRLGFPVIAPLLVLLTAILHTAVAKVEKKFYCGACLAIVDEVNLKIKAVDPKKTVEVGSFRVDPNGNQKLKEVSFATSEIYLTDVFENVCNTMNEYGEKWDQDLKIKHYVRTSSPDATPIDLIGVQMDEKIVKNLRSACHNLVEDYEEDMIKMFKKKPNQKANMGRDICLNLAKVCNSNDVLAKALWDSKAEERKIQAKKKKEEEEKKKLEEDMRRKAEEKEDEEEGTGDGEQNVDAKKEEL